MSATRRTVLEALARESDADGATTTVEVLSSTLDADRSVVRDHVEALVDCELAVRSGEAVRVSVTGEELLALDVGAEVVVTPPCGER